MSALLVIPLALTGVGYALFSQELTLDTSAIKPSYTTAQGLRVTYNRTVSPVSTVYLHQFNPITITNNRVGNWASLLKMSFMKPNIKILGCQFISLLR